MSNPRVTITLGRSGQVVERGGDESDYLRGYNVKVSGSKRSTVDRHGVGSNQWPGNKRQRSNDIEWRSAENGQQDNRLSRNDLRLKLMRKRLPKQRPSGRDLHEAKLPNTVQTPSSHHMRQYKSEVNGSASLRKIPARESMDDLHLVDSLRNQYSSRVTNGFRGRSPDRTLRSLGISPPRHYGEFWKVSPVRSGWFPSRGVVSASQPMGDVHISMKGPGSAKLVSHFPPGRGSMQQSSFMGDEPRSVAALLHSLGLGKYAILFQAEEVDMTALRQMGDKDLKDLGLPMGPRKKILLALVAPRSKRQPQ